VQHVLRFRSSTFLVAVDQHDLAGRAAQDQRVGGGAADHAGADDPDLHDPSGCCYSLGVIARCRHYTAGGNGRSRS
jgi:hypothetical protein